MSSLRDIMDVDVEPLPQTLRKPTRERTTPDNTTADQLAPSTTTEQRDNEGKAPIKRRRSNRAGQASPSEARSIQGDSSAVTDSMDPNHQFGSSSHRQTSATSSTRHSSRGSDVAEGSVKYTPVTGRVSRAKKGQPVHVCDICKPSKTFTRAEHLRRHQLSHTKPAFPCTFQDCERAFHRPDLLARHMNRHETQGEKPYKALRNRSRASSAESSRTGTPLMKVEEQSQHGHPSSSEPIDPRSASASTPANSATLGSQFQPINAPSPGPSEQNYPMGHQHSSEATVGVGALFPEASAPSDDMFHQFSQITPRNPNPNYYSEQPLFQIPSNYQFGSFPGGAEDLPSNLQLQIPDQPYPGLYSQDNNSSPWYSSDSPYSTPSDVSRSGKSWDYRDRSVSIGAMPDVGYIPPPSPWLPPRASSGLHGRNQGLSSLYEGIDELSYLPPNAAMAAAPISYDPESGSVRNPSGASNARLGGQSLGYRYSKAVVEIDHISGNQGGWRTGGQLEEYLSAYWRFFDPLSPIIHRPTFDPEASPVLRLAMAAVGTQFSPRSMDREIGSELHMECKRMIGLSTGPDTPSMLAIILTEKFARFRSQKIDVGPSKAFKTLYDYLLGKIAQDSASPFSRIDSERLQTLLASTSAPESQPDTQNPSKTRIWQEWIAFETRQRLRSACFIWDVHQSLYYEQPPSRPDVNVQTTEIVFPCPHDIWISKDPEEWCEKISSGRYISRGPVGNVSDPGDVESKHKQHLLICSLLSILPRRDLKRISPQTEADTEIIATTFTDSIIAHGYLQFYHTPLRDILAISGDTWVFGHKIKTQADFEAIKRRLYKWSTSPQAAKATWHACHVLKLASDACNTPENRGSYSIYAYWSMYTAALICWAFGHRKAVSNVAGEMALDPEATAAAYVETMTASNWKDIHAIPSNRGEFAVVQVVKQRLDIEGVGGKCGLLVDATIVLGQILDRGGRWF